MKHLSRALGRWCLWSAGAARRLVSALLLAPGLGLWAGPAAATEPVYSPRAEQVAGPVYAIVGPLGQRSQANAGLNANYGFVIGRTGVILIDSGASAYSAALLHKAVQAVTDKPVRWVLNTGSQDHRWLGNAYFAGQGAELQALAATARTQQAVASAQLAGMQRFVDAQMNGTQALVAQVQHTGAQVSLQIDGVQLQWLDTSAHYPGDTMIHLPEHGVSFTGDLVYVDRLLGVLPQSSVRKAQAAFERLKALQPRRIVPGHGRVTDLAQAQKETGDYYRFLIEQVGAAARNMEPMDETLARHARPAAFVHLQNFEELHRANMNRVFTDFEANP